MLFFFQIWDKCSIAFLILSHNFIKNFYKRYQHNKKTHFQLNPSFYTSSLQHVKKQREMQRIQDLFEQGGNLKKDMIALRFLTCCRYVHGRLLFPSYYLIYFLKRKRDAHVTGHYWSSPWLHLLIPHSS